MIYHDTPVTVPNTRHYRRRLAVGDLVEVEESTIATDRVSRPVSVRKRVTMKTENEE
jgi:hypothetical protein